MDLIRLQQLWQQHDNIVKYCNIVLDSATLLKLTELIMCNIGIVQWTVVFQEHALKVFEGGRHLPLHVQPVISTYHITRHHGNGLEH